ncbi:CPBP family intramembrane glutamic endopeptidase [Kordiimonas lipolytica]|uniref:CPBP family intramembrane glutamic endopeptidase n=1 Tax=Kordiimonas lipolytica TaxID=1662421 RepID=A0ABV8U740_9PROT|nr:CPBP family intramembrane glutamic endopeptidase [Kordiimonas lipolytica]
MNNLKTFLLKRPVVGSACLIAISLLLVLGIPYLLGSQPELKLIAKTSTRLLAAIAAAYLLWKMNWAWDAGLTRRPWRRRWWIAPLPMLAIVGINLLGVNWSKLAFTPTATAGWLGYNLSVGLFEELLLRGVCFCLLATAWRQRKNGLLLAAVTQGAIFGLLHLINLVHAPVLDTVSQTVYATLLGIGFAGMTVFCRSIWPAVMVHTAINLAGSMNSDLVPGAIQAEGSLEGYIVATVVILLVSALPGVWQLRKEQRALVGASA